MYDDGALEALLERIAVALERRTRERGHPRDNWCEAMTSKGDRCLKDAEADGLCTMHWRMKHRGDDSDGDA